jgi:hypothetical protein
MQSLLCYQLFQQTECIHRSCWQLIQVGEIAKQSARLVLLQKRLAFARDYALRASRHRHPVPCPDGRSLLVAEVTKPSASAFMFQALTTTGVAPPRGLVREKEMEGDS